MTTSKQFQEAFAATDHGNIVIETKTHKRYYLHRDQLSAIMDGYLCYGVPLKPHPRRRNRVYWFDPENVKIIDDDPIPRRANPKSAQVNYIRKETS